MLLFHLYNIHYCLSTFTQRDSCRICTQQFHSAAPTHGCTPVLRYRYCSFRNIPWKRNQMICRRPVVGSKCNKCHTPSERPNDRHGLQYCTVECRSGIEVMLPIKPVCHPILESFTSLSYRTRSEIKQGSTVGAAAAVQNPRCNVSSGFRMPLLDPSSMAYSILFMSVYTFNYLEWTRIWHWFEIIWLLWMC